MAARDCFANKTQATTRTAQWQDNSSGHEQAVEQLDLTGWTAEISYEHYGNGDDNKSSESNRRSVSAILARPRPFDHAASSLNGSPIVLAKLDRPVRFR